jgi:hypothetical protein
MTSVCLECSFFSKKINKHSTHKVTVPSPLQDSSSVRLRQKGVTWWWWCLLWFLKTVDLRALYQTSETSFRKKTLLTAIYLWNQCHVTIKKKTLLTGRYLLGLGIRHYGPEIQHMWWCSHRDALTQLVMLSPWCSHSTDDALTVMLSLNWWCSHSTDDALTVMLSPWPTLNTHTLLVRWWFFFPLGWRGGVQNLLYTLCHVTRYIPECVTKETSTKSPIYLVCVLSV